MPPLNASFQIRIPVLDSSGYVIDRYLDSMPYDSGRGQYNSTSLPDSNLLNVVLPSPTIFQLFIKNIDPNAVLTVNWTPQGGASNKSQDLAPGSMMMLWDVIGGAGGITALSLQSSLAAGCKYEIFLGA